jgi:hypothetical protein
MENLEPKKELQVKVKHLIEYLQKEFNPESNVFLDKDGWDVFREMPKDEIELIRMRGIFDKFDGNLFINN